MAKKRGGLQLFAKILDELDLRRRQRYIKKEFQAYGLQLATELNDWPHRSLYIRLAKTVPRPLLEKARLFVRDQPRQQVKNRARLFMWKLTQLRHQPGAKIAGKDNRQPLPRRQKH